MVDATTVRQRAEAFLAGHDPSELSPLDWLRARFDAGLAWVHFPEGLGGLGAPRDLQGVVDQLFRGTPDNNPGRIGIGLGMAAPTILAYGTEEQKRRFLRPLWTGEEVWCQLFSEPGAGSDLAGLATRAVRDGDDWVVDGQKVWTSSAHLARWGILVARHDPDLPKHRGLTYFVCDMEAPGVEVRPLRQITGEAEFNEVFLTGVRLGDDLRLGEVGDGWRVAQTTLMNERVAIGASGSPRRTMMSVFTEAWQARPELRTHDLHRRALDLWVQGEVMRLTGQRLREQLLAGHPGPEGSGMKLLFARHHQEVSALEVEFLREDGLTYDDWTFRRPDGVDFLGRGAGYRYLRAKGNSIEGGTSEILRNIVAERVLGLPAEPRTDVAAPWKDLPR
ncbi:acyl-CoA dehydrogenase [Herbidospora sp. NEAU-GS84]|uniref:Acyl-CoA dehydrogenase n=1 Tax=Herbidospora solisilvae TaxID=2696284 RepID=A0A7C9N3T0_9ACTN|nr:acyl-CoA dehydrogenase [Herbidospora solisilvae]